MKNHGMKIKHSKQRNEWAEMCFMIRAAEHGLSVTKPWSELSRYDFVVEYKAHFVRVQVKSTIFKQGGGYNCGVRNHRGPYLGDPFDFVAAYVIPEDSWYIIPAEKAQGAREHCAPSQIEGFQICALQGSVASAARNARVWGGYSSWHRGVRGGI
jgi:hypothetical protein